MNTKQAKRAHPHTGLTRSPAAFVSGMFRRCLQVSCGIGLIALSACGEGGTTSPLVGEPAVVQIQQDDTQILVGNELALSVEVRDALGTLLTSPLLIWVTGSPNVTTVDGNGLV